MRTVLPVELDAVIHPDLARYAVRCRVGGVEGRLVLLVAPWGLVGALWVLGGRAVDCAIVDA